MLATGAKFTKNQVTCFQLDQAVLNLYTCKILVRLDHFCIILEQFIFTTYNITYKKDKISPLLSKYPLYKNPHNSKGPPSWVGKNHMVILGY